MSLALISEPLIPTPTEFPISSVVGGGQYGYFLEFPIVLVVMKVYNCFEKIFREFFSRFALNCCYPKPIGLTSESNSQYFNIKSPSHAPTREGR